MTPPVLRVVARALQLQRDVESARELAARYAADAEESRAEAGHWLVHFSRAMSVIGERNDENDELRVKLKQTRR